MNERETSDLQKTGLNLKGEKTGDPFWDNLVTYDDDGPTDISERVDDYLYGDAERPRGTAN